LELALPLLRPAFIRELSLNLVPSLSSNDGLMLAFIAAAAVRNAAVNRKLRINAEEANTVRLLFDLYLRLGSVRQLPGGVSATGASNQAAHDARLGRSGGTAFSRGHLYLILSNPIYIVKPRTECGCQPVLAMMSSMVAPDCRRSIWITRSCLLCEGAPRRLGLGEAFRAFPCLPSYAGGRLRASGLFSVIDAKCEKAAGGDEQAKGAVVFVAAPFRCAIYGPSLLDQLSLAQGLDDFAERGTFGGQALRSGKKRSIVALGRGGEDHELAIA
jgi:hypothetical protein